MHACIRNRWIVALLAAIALLASLAGCGGGGGGGGGGGNPVTVTGKVLRAETNGPTTAAATITFGGTQYTTSADGTFTATGVPSNLTTATVSAAQEQTRTISFALKPSGTTDLGNIYLSDTGYTATVTGRIVTRVNNQTQPVGGATVTIANVTTTSAVDGTFKLEGLPIGLGSANGFYGRVTASGFDDKLITADTLGFALVAGANPIGDLLIARPSGSVPPPPYTITGVVQVNGVATKGVTVSLSQAGTTLGTTTTDANGSYFFWVAPGTYTVTASNPGVTSQQVSVTLATLDNPVTVNTINLVP